MGLGWGVWLFSIFCIQVFFLGLQIIERSLPKKQKVKKDPSMIEKEEMERIGKVWVNIVRRDIPKHQRIFINFHRKQLIDAKRFSENCQREASKTLSNLYNLKHSGLGCTSYFIL